MMKAIIVKPFLNGHNRALSGQVIEVSESRFSELAANGLVKAWEGAGIWPPPAPTPEPEPEFPGPGPLDEVETITEPEPEEPSGRRRNRR